MDNRPIATESFRTGTYISEAEGRSLSPKENTPGGKGADAGRRTSCGPCSIARRATRLSCAEFKSGDISVRLPSIVSTQITGFTESVSAEHKSSTQASHCQSASAASRMIRAASFGVRTVLSRSPNLENIAARRSARLRFGSPAASAAPSASSDAGPADESLAFRNSPGQSHLAARKQTAAKAAGMVDLPNLVLIKRPGREPVGECSPFRES